MDSGFRIGRILGIPIHLHPTWFLVFLLVVLQLWGYLANEYPSIAPAWRVGIALVASGLLFGSILMHELGHSVVALHHGVAVRSITLFIFGGLAWMEREPDSPRAELEIALAGPAVNFLLFGLFGGLAGAFGAGSPGMAVFQWLAVLNLAVALFNLLPGFPLDGGRVLRAVLWARGRQPAQATRLAARIGQGIAYALVGLGAAVAFADLASGLWLAFIGWFILTASVAYRRQATFEISLRGLVARDAMTPRVPTVEAGLPVARFARDHLLRGDRWAIVLSGGEPCGLVSRTDVKNLPPERWETTRVEEIATPMASVTVAPPEMPLAEVLRLLSGRHANQVPIVDGGRILGAVTLQNLLQAIEVRVPEPAPAGRGTAAAQGRVLSGEP
jgi:Zn-dependent protease/predicted transcriptional regulator